MSKENDAGRPKTRMPESADLGQQYGAIGISAVAAVLPYVGTQKRSPTEPKLVTIRDLELLLG
jgi:hypothetical protein